MNLNELADYGDAKKRQDAERARRKEEERLVNEKKLLVSIFDAATRIALGLDETTWQGYYLVGRPVEFDGKQVRFRLHQHGGDNPLISEATYDFRWNLSWKPYDTEVKLAEYLSYLRAMTRNVRP